MRYTCSYNMFIGIKTFEVSAHFLMPGYDSFVRYRIFFISELDIVDLIKKLPHSNIWTTSPFCHNITQSAFVTLFRFTINKEIVICIYITLPQTKHNIYLLLATTHLLKYSSDGSYLLLLKLSFLSIGKFHEHIHTLTKFPPFSANLGIILS